jgi:predicted lipoprotein with Yx(FWY)xxD motif
MQRTNTTRGSLLLAAALIAGLVAAFYATRSSGAAANARARVVMTAKNARLGKTILVNRRGMTLYSLSVERHGKFICTSSCLSAWTPLVVRKGTIPTGVNGLSTVKRPDGKRQVAFKGAPLYTFNGDKKRGDVKGNGFKDVGTWRVVAVGKGSVSPPPPPSTSTSTTTSTYPGY